MNQTPVTPLTNPYFDEFQKLKGEHKSYFSMEMFLARDQLTRKYAWAIPNSEALEAIAKCSPIVEIGAGTGYWASLLQQLGASVVAYDEAPPDDFLTQTNEYCNPGVTYTRVIRGCEDALLDHQDRALLLCWPMYDVPMAANCLRLYTGSTVIYIGEGDGGCTGDDAFHELLTRHFRLEDEIDIPCWPSIHDSVRIYKR